MVKTDKKIDNGGGTLDVNDYAIFGDMIGRLKSRCMVADSVSKKPVDGFVFQSNTGDIFNVAANLLEKYKGKQYPAYPIPSPIQYRHEDISMRIALIERRVEDGTYFYEPNVPLPSCEPDRCSWHKYLTETRRALTNLFITDLRNAYNLGDNKYDGWVTVLVELIKPHLYEESLISRTGMDVFESFVQLAMDFREISTRQ